MSWPRLPMFIRRHVDQKMTGSSIDYPTSWVQSITLHDAHWSHHNIKCPYPCGHAEDQSICQCRHTTTL